MTKNKLQQLKGSSIASGLLTIGSSPSNRHFCQGGRKNLYGKYDRIIKKTGKTIFLLSSLLLLINVAHAATWYTDSSADDPNDVNNWWSTTNNSGGHPDNFDGPGDVFIIQADHDYITTDEWIVANRVQINGALTAANNVSVGVDLVVDEGGILYINESATVTVTQNINGSGGIEFLGAGTLKVGMNYNSAVTLTTVDGSTVEYIASPTDKTMKPADYYHLIINKGAGIGAAVRGPVNVAGNLTIQSGKLRIETGAVITVSGETTIEQDGILRFHNSNTEVVTLADLHLNGGQLGEANTGTVNCENLTCTAGSTSNINRCELTVSGTTTVEGTLIFSSTSGAKTFLGDVIVNGSWDDQVGLPLICGGDLTVNGDFNNDNSVTLNGTDKTIGGTAISINLKKLIINGSYTNEIDSLINTGSLEGSGSFMNGAGKVVNLGSSCTVATLDATADQNKFYYGGGSSLDIKATTYHHLEIIANPGINVNMNDNVNVKGKLTITSGNLNVGQDAVLDVDEETYIELDGYLKNVDVSGQIELADLYLNGGDLGGIDGSIINCTTLNITGTTSYIWQGELTVTDNTNVEGTLTFGSKFGNKKFLGDVLVNGSWVDPPGIPMICDGNLTVNGEFNNANRLTLTGTDKIIGGNTERINLAKLFVDGTYSNEVDTLWLISSLEGGGSLTNEAGGLIKISNTPSIETLVATADDNTVMYGGSVSFDMKATTYHHLVISTTDTLREVRIADDITVDVNGDIEVRKGGLKIQNNSVLNQINTESLTTIGTEGRLNFEASGTANLGHLVMNGGDLGTTDAKGTLSCSSLTIAGETTNEISQGELTVNGPATIDGTVDLTSKNGTKTFEGDVTVNGTWNNNGNATVIMNSNLIINGIFNSPTGSTTVTGINNTKK